MSQQWHSDRKTNKKPRVRKLYLSELSPREVTWTPPQVLPAIVSVRGCPPETDSRPYFWRQHILESQNTEKSAGTHLDTLSLLLMALEGAMHMTGGEKWVVSPSGWSSIVNELVRHTYWFNRGMNVIWPTSHFLMGFKACSTRWSLWIERPQVLEENLLLLFC